MREDSNRRSPIREGGHAQSEFDQVRTVKARYFRYVDTKDWTGLATVFASYARFDRGFGSAVRNPVTGSWSTPLPPRSDVVDGREEIVAMVRRSVEGLWTVHRGHHCELTMRKDGTVHAIWAMSDQLRDANGRLLLKRSGHYEDTYCIEDGAWRIASSCLTRLFIERSGEV